MARDAVTVLENVWSTGPSASVENPAFDTDIDFVRGWDDAFSSRSGLTPSRSHFNWFMQLLTAMVAELNKRGLFEWRFDVNYEHPAICMGSNGGMYASLLDSRAINPTTDESYWKRIDAGSLTDLIMTFLTETLGDNRYYRRGDIDTAIAVAVVDFLNVMQINDLVNAAIIVAGAFSQVQAEARYYLRDRVDELIGNSIENFLTGSDIDALVRAAVFNPGIITANPSMTVPIGWLLCDGRAVSRTEYEELFDVVGTHFGIGDGSTTFNIPDYQGRMIIGKRSQDAIGSSGGNRNVTLSNIQITSHEHSRNVHTHSVGSHNHSVSSHAHSLPSHSHSVSAHSHSFSVSSHTHSGGGSHTHSYTQTRYRNSIIIGQSGSFSEPGGFTTRTTGSGGGGTSSLGGGGSGNTLSISGTVASRSYGSTSSASSSSSSGGGGSTGSSGGGNTSAVGSGNSHNNMPPYSVVTWIIKT